MVNLNENLSNSITSAVTRDVYFMRLKCLFTSEDVVVNVRIEFSHNLYLSLCIWVWSLHSGRVINWHQREILFLNTWVEGP